MLQSEYCIRRAFSAHGEYVSLPRHFRAEKQRSYDFEVVVLLFCENDVTWKRYIWYSALNFFVNIR